MCAGLRWISDLLPITRNKMISFIIIKEENKDEVLDRLLVKMPEADFEYATEIIDSRPLDEECE